MKHARSVLAFSAIALPVVSSASIFASKDSELCTSPACIHAASLLLRNLAPNYKEVDPCDNFDVMVCQGFQDRNQLRPDQSSVDTTTFVEEDLDIVLRQILESNVSSIAPADRENFQKVQADYIACMDEDAIQEQGLEPLKELVIDNIIREYTAAAESEKKQLSPRQNLTEVYMLLNRLGVGALVSVDVQADIKDPDTQVIYISPAAPMGLPSKEYYENNKTLASYRKMLDAVLPNFIESANKTSSRQRRDSKDTSGADLTDDLVSFEKALSQISTPLPEYEDDDERTYRKPSLLRVRSMADPGDETPGYNKMNLSQLHSALPELSLVKVIETFAPKDYNSESVIVTFPAHLRELSSLIEGTPRDVIQAFLVWQAVQTYASGVQSAALKPYQSFNNQLGGKDSDAKPTRWRTCVSTANSHLGWSLSKFFVEKSFSAESRKFGNQIVYDIKDTFETFINESTWMVEADRERAVAKVHAIVQEIGYPSANPDMMDPSDVKQYYKAVHIANDTFFDNVVSVAEFNQQRMWARLGEPTQRGAWQTTVPTVNAYYNARGNEIVFPAGIMQAPMFYDPSVPQYLSYGAFGSVSGHELSHAFDNDGSQFDETGKYEEWWSNQTRKAFDEKTQCFVKQYDNFTVTAPDGEKVHVNGELTLGENIADAGGVHAAFIAWRKREKANPGKLLPGLDYFSKEQLFFVNYANWWCEKQSREAAVQQVYTDEHAPNLIRILGTMANSADFREAFKCPSKKPTCELW